MKLKKLVLLFSLMLAFTGCASEQGELSYNENGEQIYLQQEQQLYVNNNEGFKIACRNEWQINVDDKDYLTKFVMDTGKGQAWLGIKKEIIDSESKDIKTLESKYSKLLQDGIVKSINVTIGGKKGRWIKIEPMDNSGFGVTDKDGNSVKIDESKLLTSDVNDKREDLIFVPDGNFVYVFLYHADNLSIYNNYETQVDSFLGTFQFIEK